MRAPPEFMVVTPTLLFCFSTFVTGTGGAVLALVGQTVTLPCHTELEFAVDWQHEHPADEIYSIVAYNAVVVNGFVGRFTIDSSVKGDYNLVIKDVRVSDAGHYTCIEDAGQGDTHSFELNVIDSDASVTATVGQKVSLPCQSSSPTTVDWWYQLPPKEDVSFVCLSGRVINGYTERFRVETEGNNKIHDLVIKRVQASDTGLYTCIEDAGQGKSHYVYLSVTDRIATSRTKTTASFMPAGSTTNYRYFRRSESSVLAVFIVLLKWLVLPVIICAIALTGCCCWLWETNEKEKKKAKRNEGIENALFEVVERNDLLVQKNADEVCFFHQDLLHTKSPSTAQLLDED